MASFATDAQFPVAMGALLAVLAGLFLCCLLTAWWLRRTRAIKRVVDLYRMGEDEQEEAQSAIPTVRMVEYERELHSYDDSRGGSRRHTNQSAASSAFAPVPNNHRARGESLTNNTNNSGPRINTFDAREGWRSDAELRLSASRRRSASVDNTRYAA